MVVEPDLPDTEILCSFICNPSVLYTHSPYLGVQGKHPQENGGSRAEPPRIFFGMCVGEQSLVDPWYWVNPRIFPLYFPYKRKHCKSTAYGIVLYQKRDCESVKRKCNGFTARCIPSSFWTVIKGLTISLWTQPIVWVNRVCQNIIRRDYIFCK